MGFLRVECRCTNFRQSWTNKDEKLVLLSLDMIYASNIKRTYFKHIKDFGYPLFLPSKFA